MPVIVLSIADPSPKPIIGISIRVDRTHPRSKARLAQTTIPPS
jgi:hypothetical protein